MQYPRFMIMVMSVLTFGLLSLGTPVQAMAPENATTTITLEQPVHFEDTQGEEVLVAPGTYAVTAGQETLHLTDLVYSSYSTAGISLVLFYR